MGNLLRQWLHPQSLLGMPLGMPGRQIRFSHPRCLRLAGTRLEAGMNIPYFMRKQLNC